VVVIGVLSGIVTSVRRSWYEYLTMSGTGVLQRLDPLILRRS
jgi:hypothetical protein